MFDNLPTNKQKQKQGDLNSGFQNKAPRKQTQAPAPAPNQVKQPATPKSRPIVPKVQKPIEDMFSGTDNQEKPAIFQAKSAQAPINPAQGNPPAQVDPYTGEQIKAKNKTIVFALMLISLMLVAMLGWYAWRVFFNDIIPGQTEINTQADVDMIIAPVNIEQKMPTDLPDNNFNNINTEQVLDSDGDGLSDVEERELGTNPLEADTDGDGLFDREEIKVYKTDPKDADTDRDGYADGMEVNGGYNPNGEGNLYKLED